MSPQPTLHRTCGRPLLPRLRAGCTGIGLMAGVALMVACGPARADVPSLAAGSTAATADSEFTIDVDRVTVELPPPPGAGREWRGQGSAPPAWRTAGSRTMLWSRNGALPSALQLGMGVEQAVPAPPGSTAALGAPAQPRVLVGAALDTSATTQLTWRTPLQPSWSSEAQPARTMEFSLVLKPQDALANLRRGSLMKMELSGQTQLSLRPRGGGRIALQLTSKW